MNCEFMKIVYEKLFMQKVFFNVGLGGKITNNDLKEKLISLKEKLGTMVYFEAITLVKYAYSMKIMTYCFSWRHNRMTSLFLERIRERLSELLLLLQLNARKLPHGTLNK